MVREFIRLSAREVQSLSEPGRHADGGGLYLVIEPSGSKRWVMLYRMPGRRREMGLGSLSAVPLAKARELAAAARAQIADGVDPIEARIAAAVAPPPPAPVTFADVTETHMADREKTWRNPAHRAQWRQTLEVQAVSLWTMPVEAIGTDDVLSVLRPLWHEKAETARRIRGRIEPVLDAAPAGGHRSGEDPARGRGHLDVLLPQSRKLTWGHHRAMPCAAVPALPRGARGRADELLVAGAAVHDPDGGAVRRDARSDLGRGRRGWCALDRAGRAHEGRPEAPRAADRAGARNPGVGAAARGGRFGSGVPLAGSARRSRIWCWRFSCAAPIRAASPSTNSVRRFGTGLPQRPTSRASSRRPRSPTSSATKRSAPIAVAPPWRSAVTRGCLVGLRGSRHGRAVENLRQLGARDDRRRTELPGGELPVGDHPIDRRAADAEHHRGVLRPVGQGLDGLTHCSLPAPPDRRGAPSERPRCNLTHADSGRPPYGDDARPVLEAQVRRAALVQPFGLEHRVRPVIAGGPGPNRDVAETLRLQPRRRLVLHLVGSAGPDLDRGAGRVERQERADDRVAGLVLVAGCLEGARVLVAAGPVEEVRAALMPPPRCRARLSGRSGLGNVSLCRLLRQEWSVRHPCRRGQNTVGGAHGSRSQRRGNVDP